MVAEWSVLLLAGGEAVCQVLIIVACGVLLSRTGCLSHSGQKAVSKLNLYFLTPCLLFTKMASTITWSQFKAFWPIPLIYTLYSLINWFVAKAGSRFLRFSRDEEKFVIASVFFSNTNSLPMALVQSLAMSGAGNRLLRDEMDSKEMVMARGMSYILFYAIFGNLVRWSYGFSLLVPRDEDERGQGKGAVEEKGLEGRRMSAREGEVCIEIERGIRDASSSLSTTDNNPQTLHTHNPSPSSTLNPSGTTPTTFKQKFTIFFDKLCQVLTPPLMTALIALVIGLVPALHQFFMSPESKFYTFVIHPLEECGEGAIPLILLCLGAQVVHLTASSSSPDLDTASPPSPAVESASGKSKQVGRSSSIQPDNGMSPLDAIAEEDEKVRQEHDRLSVKRIEDGLMPRLPLSHASSSVTLYQPEALVISPSTTRSEPTTYSGASLDNNGPPTPPLETPQPHNPTINNATNTNNTTHRRLLKRVSPVGFAILARTLIAPLICLPLILFHPASLSPILTTDPVFKMVLVLVAAAPTAINLTQLCQIKGFFEREMASMLFWSYCVLGVPLVLGWSLVGLWAAER